MVNVWKGYGRLFMEQGRTWKSLKYLRKADAYYAVHALDESGFRTENLDYMKVVLSRQKRQLGLLTGILTGLMLLALGFFLARKKAPEADAPAAEPARKAGKAPELSAREKEILDLLSKGYTTPQIAGALSLSHETIRWYRKKLIAKFEASNTAELISLAKELGLI